MIVDTIPVPAGEVTRIPVRNTEVFAKNTDTSAHDLFVVLVER